MGLRNVAAHNCRENVYDDAGQVMGELPDWISHPERAEMNEGDRCGGLAVLRDRGTRIEKADLLRKPQKNASAAIEVSLSASPDWFDSHKPSEWKAYLKDCRKFIEERFGKENVLHWATHYDEKTPHAHVLLVPIMEGTVRGKHGLKYSSGEFLGGRNGLRDLQDEIATQVGEKYGLERGIEGSKARHTDQYQWAAELADSIPAHEARKAELEAQGAELDRREAALAKRMADFEKRSAVKVKVFTPVLDKKPAVPLMMVFNVSDGTQVKGSYEEYRVREVTHQANEYGKKMAEIAQAAQVKAARYEADAKRLPEVGEQLSEAMTRYTKLEDQYRRLSPAALRAEADKREAAIEKRQERDRDRGGQER